MVRFVSLCPSLLLLALAACTEARRGGSNVYGDGWVSLGRGWSLPPQAQLCAKVRRRRSEVQQPKPEPNPLLQALSKPVLPQGIWERLTGRELLDNPECLEKLAQQAELLVRIDDNNPWIDWKLSNDSEDVRVWTGKSKDSNTFGAQLPWFKSRSVVPYSPEELVELLLDSGRVQTYNPWSVGRQDVWKSLTTNLTKVVKNRTQPPLGSTPLVAVTLLHAKRLANDNWLVVSRAIGGPLFRDDNTSGEDDSKSDRPVQYSDMLLGVNLLEPTGPNSCRLTAITHVSTPSVPTILAERLGVKSAVKFVSDLRAAATVDSSGSVLPEGAVADAARVIDPTMSKHTE